VPGGEIVIAEARTGRVQVFDDKGAYLRLITLPPSALTKELTVFGAGAAPDGKVVVSRAGDLLVLDPKVGTVERTIRGSYPEVFYHGDVDIAQDGSIWATIDRTGDLSTMHLSAAGKILGKVAKTGSNHVAVDGIGTMYLTKRFDAAVEVRDGKGEILRKFSQAGADKLSSPGAVAIDGKGHVFVAESSRVIVFDSEGAFLGALAIRGGVSDLAVDRSGALYVLRRNSVTKYELTLPATK
jgi:sugar lactone lactonase YvrE